MNKYVKVTGEFGEKPQIEFLVDELPDELIVETFSEGEGVYIEPSQVVAFDYLGAVFGGEEFDNSFDRGQPLVTPVGVGHLIRGWDIGLLEQRVGSRVLLIIPPRLGYGEDGVPQAGIPGNASLVFVTDIVSIM